jgi:hypothetical protein
MTWQRFQPELERLAGNLDEVGKQPSSLIFETLGSKQQIDIYDLIGRLLMRGDELTYNPKETITLGKKWLKMQKDLDTKVVLSNMTKKCEASNSTNYFYLAGLGQSQVLRVGSTIFEDARKAIFPTRITSVSYITESYLINTKLVQDFSPMDNPNYIWKTRQVLNSVFEGSIPRSKNPKAWKFETMAYYGITLPRFTTPFAEFDHNQLLDLSAKAFTRQLCGGALDSYYCFGNTTELFNYSLALNYLTPQDNSPVDLTQIDLSAVIRPEAK